MTDRGDALSVTHATLVFDRVIDATPDVVFGLFANPAERTIWATPSASAVLIFDETAFREGGTDRFRCGDKRDPSIQGTTRYLEIVPNQRIISSETLDMDGRRLGVSLATVKLAPAGNETRLRLTVQIASLIGDQLIQGHTDGQAAALDQLVRHAAG